MMKLFVYGTLRKGEENAFLLKNATCLLESCWTNGQLYDTGEGYPAMVPSNNHRTIGELYEVSNEQLKLLDELEEYEEGSSTNLYNRVNLEINSINESVFANVYIANQPFLLQNSVENGDWILYKKKIYSENK